MYYVGVIFSGFTSFLFFKLDPSILKVCRKKWQSEAGDVIHAKPTVGAVKVRPQGQPGRGLSLHGVWGVGRVLDLLLLYG